MSAQFLTINIYGHKRHQFYTNLTVKLFYSQFTNLEIEKHKNM